jgi:hypothetical protein
MSNPNQSDKSPNFELNESGELVVKNPELAKALEELNSEELDAIAGGKNAALSPDSNGTCNTQCRGAEAMM